MLIKQFFDGLVDQVASFRILYIQRPHTLDVALDMYDEYVTFVSMTHDFQRPASQSSEISSSTKQ